MYLDDIERIALKGLRDNLAHSDVIAAYVDEYAARKRLKRAASQDHARFERRAGEIKREINRLVDSIVKGVPPETLAPRLRDLETERGTVRASLEAAKERDSVITLHPGALTRYKAAVAELAKELARGEPDKVAGSLAVVRELVTAIIVHAAPSAAGGDMEKTRNERRIRIDIKGRLAAICGDPVMLPMCPGRTIDLLVAGVRYIAKPTIAEALFSYRRAA